MFTDSLQAQLIDWLRVKVPALRVDNFTKVALFCIDDVVYSQHRQGWSDGRAILALIDALNPGSVVLLLLPNAQAQMHKCTNAETPNTKHQTHKHTNTKHRKPNTEHQTTKQPNTQTLKYSTLKHNRLYRSLHPLQTG
jgi:hypothetical protein